jgi:hypothetical protein
MDRISESHDANDAGGNRSFSTVGASLNYIAESSEKPVYYAYEPPAGTPRVTGTFVAQTVLIRNAREVVDDLSLDKQGFELTHQETAVQDFYDQEEVKRIYYPEVELLLKEATGAERSSFSTIRCAIFHSRSGVRRTRENMGKRFTTTTRRSPVRAGCAIICRRPRPISG